jgi:hypothetical protein
VIEVPQTEDYGKNAAKARGEDYPCVVCGRAVKYGSSTGHVVHLGNGGGYLLLPTEVDPAASDYLGLYPLGGNCLKKHPELRPYVVAR